MRYRCPLALLICLFGISICRAQEAPLFLEKAREIDVGSFCLSNISPGSGVVTVGQSYPKRDGSLWWEVHIHVGPHAEKKPTAYFYSKLRQADSTGPLTTCSETDAFLAGKLDTADIYAYYRLTCAASGEV